jgi:hypothetical protein
VALSSLRFGCEGGRVSPASRANRGGSGMSDSEWYGEPHTLVVHSVRLPDGPFDDGEMECDLEHAPSCKEERWGEGERSYMAWTCDVAWHERESGLASTLRYSGTPITEPGTYRIQGWGRKYYVWDYGAYEHDGGVGVMEPEGATA